jgi:hypothetical protein
MTAQDATSYGRNFDGKPGDVLDRLRQALDATPPGALATRPISRTLLSATVMEIERLRRENAALNQKGATK